MVNSDEDRSTCQCCARHRSGWCQATRIRVVPDLLQRCEHFAPIPGDPDQRTAEERWPGISSLDARCDAWVRSLPKVDLRQTPEKQVAARLKLIGTPAPAKDA